MKVQVWRDVEAEVVVRSRDVWLGAGVVLGMNDGGCKWVGGLRTRALPPAVFPRGCHRVSSTNLEQHILDYFATSAITDTKSLEVSIRPPVA